MWSHLDQSNIGMLFSLYLFLTIKIRVLLFIHSDSEHPFRHLWNHVNIISKDLYKWRIYLLKNVRNYVLIVVDLNYVTCDSSENNFSSIINYLIIFIRNITKIFNYLHINFQIAKKVSKTYLQINFFTK